MNARTMTVANDFLTVLVGLLTALAPVREATAANVFRLDAPAQASGTPGEMAQFTARVLLTQSEGDVEGYAVGLMVTPVTCSIIDVALGMGASGAELFVRDILTPKNRATAGVVMDFELPYEGKVIPAVGTRGTARELLTITIQAPVPSNGSCLACTLQLVDGLGSPPIDNIVVIGGISHFVSKSDISVDVCGNLSAAPDVDAGADMVVGCAPPPCWVQLQGSVNDPDNAPSALTIGWELLDGPGGVTFDDSADPQTWAEFLALGTYRLALTASDGQNTSTDQVQITTGEGKAVTPGLVALWRLDESVGIIAHDAAGGNDGILHGDPAWLPDGGRIGGALAFDGTGDFVDCGNSPALHVTDKITVAAWIKVVAFDKAWQAIVTKGDSSWRIQRDSVRDGIEFACTGLSVPGTSWGNVPGDISVNDGQWHHVAGVYDGTTIYLYVDGVLDTSAPASGMIAANPFSVCIGEDLEGGGREWNGLIDEVRLYRVALSRTQIMALLAPENTAPVARWPLDETGGDIAHDSVGGHHGVLEGGPVWLPKGGMVDGALALDGLNDCVVTDFVLNPADGPFSVFAWIKGGTPSEVVISQDGSQGGTDWLMADSSAGRLMTDLKGPGRFGYGLSSFMVITDGDWYEVGLAWDGDNRTLYVNGVTVAQSRQTELTGSLGGLNIGTNRNRDSGTFWSGLIDDVRIYDGAVKP